MVDSKMLLISTEPSLIKSVERVAHAVNNLSLDQVAGIDEGCLHLEREETTALVLAHVTQDSNIADVTRLLRTIASTRRPVPLLIISEQYHAEQALALLRLGVVDYLSRPLDLRRLAYLVDVLTVRARYVGVGSKPSPEPPPEQIPAQSLGESEPFWYSPYADMGRMMDQVRVVAPQDTTVLLSGETGTGKTHLARLIHELSPRRDAPFLVVNCGALSAGLIESEMFGHVKGAFTGADRDRAGKFGEVGRGTLLLDEIDALPLNLQAKLLRAVEERIFEPVGSNRSQPMRARLIAASNRALDQEAAAGRFRSDLYYRLNVVGFTLPPLRHRPWTIAPIANQYIAEFAARNGREVRGLSRDVLRVLEAYDWPGNVRELRNVIERAVALCPRPEIQVEDLPIVVRPKMAAEMFTPLPGPRHDLPPTSIAPAPPLPRSNEYSRSNGPASTLSATKEEAEIARIIEALRKHSNNRLRAAAELGISRMTLYKKLRKYNLFDFE